MPIMKKSETWIGIAIFIVVLMLGLDQSWGQAIGAAFLRNGQTPESSAMGGAGVVTSLGTSALGSNPAGLGMMNNRFQVYSMYESPMEGVQYGQLSAAVGFNGRGRLPVDGLGISVWGQKATPSAQPARQNTRVIQQPWKSEDSGNQSQIDWQLIR